MGSQESHYLAASLLSRVGTEASAVQIADGLATTWGEIEGALLPILGPRGVAALYKRSLYLIAPAYPWLNAVDTPANADSDLEPLKALLVEQSGPDAVAAGCALLQNFYDLLTSLVGASLTERLLRHVWVNTKGGLPAQDSRS